MQDERLGQRLRAGDHPAFSTWLGQLQDRLFRYARRKLGSEDDALDAVQETFVAAFQGRSSVPLEPTRRDSWLFGIASHKVTDAYRRRGRHQGGELPEGLESRDRPDQRAEARVERARVTKALDSLPAPLREALVLATVEGLTYLEIAALQGCPVGTIRSRIAAARAQLRGRLGRKDEHAPR